MSKEKDELLDQIAEITGRTLPSVAFFLKVLTHPEVIEYTKRYISSLDLENRCQNYEAPWSCAREAEARYENIRYGWLGGGSGVGYSEWWCEPCRKKVMGT